jgi:hypothetical protein
MRRRTLLAGGVAALAAPGVAAAARKPRGEVAILRAALELEKLAVFVYDAGLQSGVPGASLAPTVAGLRDHERQHVDAIASSLEALGSVRPGAPRTVQDADAQLERLGARGRLAQATSREAFLELAEEVELLQVGGYVAAAGGIDDVRLIQTCASILAAQGAHLVVIRRALGREEVPTPLERGRR